MRKKTPEINPIRRPKLEPADIHCFRALARGEAQPHQQKRALDVLIEEICDTYGLSWRADIRQTDLALGKQHVGQTIVWILNAAPVSQRPPVELPEIPDDGTE